MLLQAVLISGGIVPSFAMHFKVFSTLLTMGFFPLSTLKQTLKYWKEMESRAKNCTVLLKSDTVLVALQNWSEARKDCHSSHWEMDGVPVESR